MAELGIGLTRAVNLIIGLKPVEPLALIEETIEFTPINREYIYKLKDGNRLIGTACQLTAR
jgi:hypothetical protein